MNASLVASLREAVIVPVCMVAHPENKYWIGTEINNVSPHILRVRFGDFSSAEVLITSEVSATEFVAALRLRKGVVLLDWFGHRYEPHPLIVAFNNHDDIEGLREAIYQAHLAKLDYDRHVPLLKAA